MLKRFFKPWPKRGFTLVETMVVVGLAAIIGASLVSSFLMGVKVWRRTATPDFSRRKAILGLEKLSQELRSSYNYKAIGFAGNKTALAFANLAPDRILNISYEYLPADGCLYKSSTPWVFPPEAPQTLAPRKVVGEVTGVAFGYYGFNNVTQTYDFLDSWNYTASGVPAAVKVELQLKGGYVFKKIMEIPVGE